MTIVAGADKYCKGVAGHCVAADRAVGIIGRSCQMAVYAAYIGLVVDRMGSIPHLVVMATCAQRIGGGSRSCLLGVNLVAVDTSYTYFAVTARAPLEQGARVTGAT